MENLNLELSQHPPEFGTRKFDWTTKGVLSEDIFRRLPPLLRDCCEPFKNNNYDRDLVLLSSLVTLSACFPKISGVYNGDICYPNLYSIILAPPASGKGYAKFGVQLAEQYSEHLSSGLWDQQGKIKVGNIAESDTNKAHSKIPVKSFDTESYRFYISANSSAAALLDDIKNSRDLGCLLFDSELDVAGAIISQDWGKMYSEVFRKCFHHEHLSVSRKSGGFVDISTPKVSILFTGTSNQLSGFIRSVVDGLFSRFLFYRFETHPEWKDVSYKGGIILKEYFSELSKRVAELARQYLIIEHKFNFPPEQWDCFNARYSSKLQELHTEYGGWVDASVKRFGLITFKIAMLLTAIRFSSKIEGGRTLICSTEDFDLSFDLMSTLIYHSLSVFKEVESLAGKPESEKHLKFYNALPNTVFKREEAIQIGDEYGIPERTVGYLLSKWKGWRLSYPETGYYQKGTK